MQAERPKHKASAPRGDARFVRRVSSAPGCWGEGRPRGAAAGGQSGAGALRPPREPGAPAAPSAPGRTERPPRRGRAGLAAATSRPAAGSAPRRRVPLGMARGREGGAQRLKPRGIEACAHYALPCSNAARGVILTHPCPFSQV